MSNRYLRYQRPDRIDPNLEILPLDTVCTIIVRQSTTAQVTRNTMSAEVNPQTLIDAAYERGFTDVVLDDADLGVSAYTTTIEDRVALHRWTYEKLSSGESKVLMVSLEDRLFRDATNIQVSRFIDQVAKHGGWVIAGGKEYNFRIKWHREQFMYANRSASEFIESHVKQRLHPANRRSALNGRFGGGKVPWGYIVDYRPFLPTSKHYLKYEPHATMVRDDVFQRFAHMPNRGGTSMLANIWHREGLVFPFFADDVDPRNYHWVDAVLKTTERGYLVDILGMQTILTDLVYLGWAVREGEVLLDDAGKPRVFHETFVDPDVFWWCYDELMPERPKFAPPRIRPYIVYSRPRLSSEQKYGDVKFLGHGVWRCAKHGAAVGPASRVDGVAHIKCSTSIRDRTETCAFGVRPIVESQLIEMFCEHLRLDEADVEQLAQMIQHREMSQRAVPSDVLEQLAEYRRFFEAAHQNSLRFPKRADLYQQDMDNAEQKIVELQVRLDEIQQAQKVPYSHVWRQANALVAIAQRIRSTFGEWSRESQAKVLLMAMEQARLGHINRELHGMYVIWQGGIVSRRVYRRTQRIRAYWTEEQDAALRHYYPLLCLRALAQVFPDRSYPAICQRAQRLGIHSHCGTSLDVPEVFELAVIDNQMAEYGFLLEESGENGISWDVSSEVS